MCVTQTRGNHALVSKQRYGCVIDVQEYGSNRCMGGEGVHISIYHSFVRILWRRWSNSGIEWHLERHYLQAIVLDSNWWWIHGDNGRLAATGLSSMKHRRHRFGCLLQTHLCRHSFSLEQTTTTMTTTTTKTPFHRNTYRFVHPSTECPMHRILNKYVHLMLDRMDRIWLERPFWPDCKLCSVQRTQTMKKFTMKKICGPITQRSIYLVFKNYPFSLHGMSPLSAHTGYHGLT